MRKIGDFTKQSCQRVMKRAWSSHDEAGRTSGLASCWSGHQVTLRFNLDQLYPPEQSGTRTTYTTPSSIEADVDGATRDSTSGVHVVQR